MYKNIEDLIKSFNTNPILFMGSGITRRYYNLPNWRGLLEIFIKKINDDEYSFSAYLNRAKQEIENENNLYPKMAELIENDFNEMWFNNTNIRSNLDDNLAQKIKEGCSPFKVEISQYIKENAILNNQYVDEIEELKKISGKNIASIITTNYDNFFEQNIENFKTFVGQEELIFSTIQGIGEIYKIHGSIEKPESIVINSNDYRNFNDKGQYLAAKLLTLFMEYPIIFMGYSISDMNIQKILNDIVKCLPIEKINELKNRFVFVEYDSNISGYEIDQHTIKIDNKLLEMNKIKMSDFSILYKAIGKRKRTLPVKLLRDFKEQLAQFIITNEPTEKIKVAMLNDNNISNDNLAIAIGKIDELPIKGLQGITANEWYKNIILDDLNYEIDKLLKYADFLLRQNSGKLPLNKYLSKCKNIEEFDELARSAMENDLENIISPTIKKNRKCVDMYGSASEIWKVEKENIERATRLIAHLEISKFNACELEGILKEIFHANSKILDEPKVNTNVKRLIRIYDYLMYSDKVKELFN